MTHNTLLDGKYLILDKLGQGAYGEVFLTRHTGLGVCRAVKRIRKSQDIHNTRRHEADALKALRHASLPIIYDIDEDDVYFYIVEEYIEKKHKYLIGGDIFVYNGKVILWGLLNCHRDSSVNPLVPVGKSYPLLLDEQDKLEVENTLQSMVDKLGIRFGSVNVELVVDKMGKVWPIDVGPRAGGNMIPDLLGLIFDVDVVEMAVLTAMGEEINNEVHDGIPFYATHNLHTSQTGLYKTIDFSKELDEKIIKKCLYKKSGDCVEYFDNAAKALGIIFMKFKTKDEMETILENINMHYKVLLEEK